jgi:CubicO group peptidase (beta-lactamase class C family)
MADRPATHDNAPSKLKFSSRKLEKTTMDKKLLPALLLLVALGLRPGFAQSLEPLLKEIETYAEKAQADWQVPGFAIGIVQNDKSVYAKGFGVRELGKPDPVDEDTLFVAASNSKAFTTASLAILVDEGKLAWDDPVTKYLPEFELYDAYVTREMKVRDLVSHRSGLATFSGDLLWYDTTYSADEVLRRAQFLKPTTSFRSRYGYQNLMYIAAGKVIERISGKSWSAFVDERILTPLGMERTTTSIRDFKENVASPHNESHGSAGAKRLRPLPHGSVDNCWGACGINTSVADMSKWLRLQLGRGSFEGKQIFSNAQAWEMWQPNIFMPVSEAAATLNPSRHFTGYGLGWVLYDYHGVKVVNHSGGLDGMISQSAFVPEKNFGLVVLTNSESPLATILRDKILDVMLGAPPRDWNAEAIERRAKAATAQTEHDQKVDAARAKNTQPSLPLDQYAGIYGGELYGDVAIASEGDRLVLRMVPAPNLVADLEHWHYDTFQIHWRDTVHYNFPRGFVTFTLDGTGNSDELKIDQPNDDFWFYELELKRRAREQD